MPGCGKQAGFWPACAATGQPVLLLAAGKTRSYPTYLAAAVLSGQPIT
ncbi:hypothetical protein EPIR_1765 [Erwinia piriflorinigrans CFBP 5888]|uniref:Uncharacterized protein n=1 Tax=Erwinia piriflorinigrans CFBP 5888 TaxID=1161919 RepID=V5Z844_9GAMM|nr:hypothetical protein EPIR_1765 [Erwinia piriflorinigrans CFBP 5888]